ncbi:MAG: acyl-CoA thioesterase [Candidatus Omnitrophica bacterium]|nr:acyl-CoA thioesterase [Candidatus Omnitrophota bacterium]
MFENRTEIRVRYADTDQMGVMYYSNYLVWFEVARTEFFRSLGFDYRALEKEREIYLPVAEVECRYRASLRYDDLATIVSRVKNVGNSRLVFEYEITLGGKTVTTGLTKHAFVNRTGKPVAIPEDIREALIRTIPSE